MITCPSCGDKVLEIDVKCSKCGEPLGATGAHRMIGQVMLGQYELVDVLGQGGMSVVFKGRHKLTDQEVALKILPPELAAHSQVKSRFLEEAKALAALDHPNIVHLYNFGQENGFFVLAMQFVKGDTWERKILDGKRLDWVASCRIAIDVLRALEYAHGRGIVHRDMKPSNVLVRAHDGAATVMDFGIAKMTTSTKLTAEGQTMGTVRYMSPEQVRGHEVFLATDIYSLGATLYESLVGDTPFDGQTHFEIMTKHLTEVPKRPSELGIAVPEDVEDALVKALAKKPADRWESAKDFRKVLESALRRADVGLVDTQQISPSDVSAVRASLEPKAAPLPAATALRPAAGRPMSVTGLSEELEPDDAAASAARRMAIANKKTKPPAKKSNLVPWIALAVLVLAGGATAAVVVLKKGATKPPPRPEVALPELPGVTFATPEKFGNVWVATDGKLTADEVHAAYTAALEHVQAAAKTAALPKRPPLAPHPTKVKLILAVPQVAMCAAALYPMGAVPLDCRTAPAENAIGVHGDPTLVIASERASLGRAVDLGAARSACEFYDDKDADRVTEICEIQKQFEPAP